MPGTPRSSTWRCAALPAPRTWPALIALALLPLSGACALVPNVPAGPIAGSARFGGTWVYARAPARVRASEGTEVRFRGSGAQYGSTFPSILPRLGARFSTSDSFDFGFDLSPLELGLQLRGGPLHASRPLPWGIELELRTGATSLFHSDVVRDQNILRVRAELYPPLPFGRAASGLPLAFGVLTLAIGGGRQLVPVLPIPRDHQDSGEEGPLQSSLNVLRNETRLESSVGLHWLVKGGAFTLVTQPWLTLQQGAARASECDGCYLDLIDVDSHWGLSIALSAQLVGGQP